MDVAPEAASPEYVGNHRITDPVHRSAITNNQALGNLALLPLELRNDIYSRVFDEDYKQVYRCDPVNLKFKSDSNGIRYDPLASSDLSAVLRVNDTMRNEVLLARLHSNIRVEEDRIITDFPMYQHDKSKQEMLQAGRPFFSIPVACARINITIDPPSPQSAWTYYKTRQNVHSLVDIINSSARDKNPHIRLGLDRRFHSSMLYNDFAMLYGPFARLNRPCATVTISRTTGQGFPNPKVNRYCGLVEAAIRFDVVARRELTLHQSHIDICLPILTLKYEDYRYAYWEPTLKTLSERQLRTVKEAVEAMEEVYVGDETPAPAPNWLQNLSRHVRLSRMPEKISVALQRKVMNGRSAWEMNYWAGGLFTWNPFFDDTLFFRGCHWNKRSVAAERGHASSFGLAV